MKKSKPMPWLPEHSNVEVHLMARARLDVGGSVSDCGRRTKPPTPTRHVDSSEAGGAARSGSRRRSRWSACGRSRVPPTSAGCQHLPESGSRGLIQPRESPARQSAATLLWSRPDRRSWRRCSSCPECPGKACAGPATCVTVSAATARSTALQHGAPRNEFLLHGCLHGECSRGRGEIGRMVTLLFAGAAERSSCQLTWARPRVYAPASPSTLEQRSRKGLGRVGYIPRPPSRTPPRLPGNAEEAW